MGALMKGIRCAFVLAASFATACFSSCTLSLFFFNDPATTEIYTLSLHDALPISRPATVGARAAINARPATVGARAGDRKSTRLNSSHMSLSYAVFCLKKKNFAVRTMGLPGMIGALGVCFGQVVTFDSPKARPPGEFSWQETLFFFLMNRRPPRSTLFPYTTRFR